LAVDSYGGSGGRDDFEEAGMAGQFNESEGDRDRLIFVDVNLFGRELIVLVLGDANRVISGGKR
jgi:hypothetical protein